MHILLQANAHSPTDILSGLLGFVQMPYIYLMGLSFVFTIGSYYFFTRQSNKLGIATLFLAALLARIFMAFQDAFLHPWDERYHALVARNMLNDPLTPMLQRLPLGDYNYKLWNFCHIWVHKQPLFSWQMALSIKLFGVSEYSIRLPSALMGALITVMVYDLTMLLVRERHTAFLAALLFCYSRFHLEQVAGLYGLDHNDIALHFYVLASIWAYARYTQSKHWIWVLLAGLFAGCAVLVKWLLGLLVFGGWGINLLIRHQLKLLNRQWLHFFLALFVCLVIFLPWQLYIIHRFPIQAEWAYSFNRRHITEALENHTGNFLYYFGRLPGYFGITGSIFAMGGIVILFKRLLQKNLANPYVATPLIFAFLSLFLFFSLIVKTKTPAYVYTTAPFAAIFISLVLSEILRIKNENKILNSKILYLFWSTITLATIFSPPHIFARHNPTDPRRITAQRLNTAAKQIDRSIPAGTIHIFNAGEYQAIDMMFYHKNLSVHYGFLNKATLDSLSKNGIPFCFFASRPGRELPAYINEYPNTCILPYNN